MSELEEKISRQTVIMNLATEAVKMLLDECHTIDINAHGGIFGTALQAAAYSGQAKTVQMLLRRKDRFICNERCGSMAVRLTQPSSEVTGILLNFCLKLGKARLPYATRTR